MEKGKNRSSLFVRRRHFITRPPRLCFNSNDISLFENFNLVRRLLASVRHFKAVLNMYVLMTIIESITLKSSQKIKDLLGNTIKRGVAITGTCLFCNAGKYWASTRTVGTYRIYVKNSLKCQC